MTIMDVLHGKIRFSPSRAITYAEFMETVLYDECGYYQRKQSKIGKQGDFYTSSSVHPVFAWVIADYMDQYCLKRNLPFRICEIGAGTGAFAKQVLDYMQRTKPDRYEQLIYEVVDRSEDHLDTARVQLASHRNVVFHTSAHELSGFEGILFSNELLDALPVHVVKKEHGLVQEVMVSLDEKGELYEVTKPLSNPWVHDWLLWNDIEIPDNHRIEIPLQMVDWLQEHAALLNKGILVTIDYGYQNDELVDPALKEGTLRGYFKHKLVGNPLSNPGEMDLTTHIQFDALMHKGEELHLPKLYFGKQRMFLLENGLFNHLVEHNNPDPFAFENKLNRAIRSFATPGGMSDAFHVLIQEKGFEKCKE